MRVTVWLSLFRTAWLSKVAEWALLLQVRQPDRTEHSIYEQNCTSVHNPRIEPKVRSYLLLLEVGVASQNRKCNFTTTVLGWMSSGFILFTILCLSVRNSNAPESALSTFATLSTATRSASASLGGASRGSRSLETAALRHCQWGVILVGYERTFGSICGL